MCAGLNPTHTYRTAARPMLSASTPTTSTTRIHRIGAARRTATCPMPSAAQRWLGYWRRKVRAHAEGITVQQKKRLCPSSEQGGHGCGGDGERVHQTQFPSSLFAYPRTRGGGCQTAISLEKPPTTLTTAAFRKQEGKASDQQSPCLWPKPRRRQAKHRVRRSSSCTTDTQAADNT